MNWNTANGSKGNIENTIREIDALIRKLNSTYIVLNNDDDCLCRIVDALKKINSELVLIEEDLLDESLTMGRIHNVFN